MSLPQLGPNRGSERTAPRLQLAADESQSGAQIVMANARRSHVQAPMPYAELNVQRFSKPVHQFIRALLTPRDRVSHPGKRTVLREFGQQLLGVKQLVTGGTRETPPQIFNLILQVEMSGGSASVKQVTEPF